MDAYRPNNHTFIPTGNLESPIKMTYGVSDCPGVPEYQEPSYCEATTCCQTEITKISNCSANNQMVVHLQFYIVLPDEVHINSLHMIVIDVRSGY